MSTYSSQPCLARGAPAAALRPSRAEELHLRLEGSCHGGHNGHCHARRQLIRACSDCTATDADRGLPHRQQHDPCNRRRCHGRWSLGGRLQPQGPLRSLRAGTEALATAARNGEPMFAISDRRLERGAMSAP